MIDKEGNLQYDSEKKTNIFAEIMEKQFKTPNSRNWVDDMVGESIAQLNNLLYQKDIYFSPGEIWNEIRRLPNKRDPGPDQISNCTLKHCGKNFITFLCQIFNRLKYFPKP